VCLTLPSVATAPAHERFIASESSQAVRHPPPLSLRRVAGSAQDATSRRRSVQIGSYGAALGWWDERFFGGSRFRTGPRMSIMRGMPIPIAIAARVAVELTAWRSSIAIASKITNHATHSTSCL